MTHVDSFVACYVLRYFIVVRTSAYMYKHYHCVNVSFVACYVLRYFIVVCTSAYMYEHYHCVNVSQLHIDHVQKKK